MAAPTPPTADELSAALFFLDVAALVAQNPSPDLDLLVANKDLEGIIKKLKSVSGYQTLKAELKPLAKWEKFDPNELNNFKQAVATVESGTYFPIIKQPFFVASSCNSNPQENPAYATVNVRTDPQNSTQMTFVKMWSSEAERAKFCANVAIMEQKQEVVPSFMPSVSCEVATKFVKFDDYQNDMALALQASIDQVAPKLGAGPQEILIRLKDAIADCTATTKQIQQLQAQLKINPALTALKKKITILQNLVDKNKVPLANLVSQVDRLQLAAPGKNAVQLQTTLNALSAINTAQNSLTTYNQMATILAQAPQTVNIPLNYEQFERTLAEVQVISSLPKSSVISIGNSCFKVEPQNGNGFLTLVFEPCPRGGKVRKVDLGNLFAHVQNSNHSLVDDWHSRISAITHTQLGEKSTGVYYVAVVEAKHVRSTDVKLGDVDADGFVSVNRRMLDSNASIKVETPDVIFVLQPTA